MKDYWTRRSNGKTMPIKPLWYWDDRVKRYRNPTTGQFVGIKEMAGLRTQFLEQQKQSLVGLTRVYASETINFKTYRKQVVETLKQTYIDMYAIGKGGRNNMTQADWGKIGSMLKEQYKYLNPFMDQIEAGKLSEAQINARLKMYINSANEAFWKAYASDIPLDLPAYPGDGSTSCRVNCQCEWDIQHIAGVGYDCYWRLGVAEHCDDCIDRSGKWNPYKIRITGEASNAG